MRIVVNGAPREVEDGLTLAALVAALGVPSRFTAVAVNREVVRRGVYETMVLAAGDRVEIVRPMAGGR
jgi:sulfur carrier protein